MSVMLGEWAAKQSMRPAPSCSPENPIYVATRWCGIASPRTSHSIMHSRRYGFRAMWPSGVENAGDVSASTATTSFPKDGLRCVTRLRRCRTSVVRGSRRLVARVAGQAGGKALKDRQYLQLDYKQTPQNSRISAITEAVKLRFGGVCIVADWIDAISERSDVHPDDVRRIHGTFGILPSPTLPTPGRLLVRRVRFSGTKTVAGDHRHCARSHRGHRVGPEHSAVVCPSPSTMTSSREPSASA